MYVAGTERGTKEDIMSYLVILPPNHFKLSAKSLVNI